jgi:5-carboxymethyl-2-hydroxymuconate isomerase
MADFKKPTTRIKKYQVHSATFESGILENSDVLKRLYEIKRYRLANRYHDKWITSK